MTVAKIKIVENVATAKNAITVSSTDVGAGEGTTGHTREPEIQHSGKCLTLLL